MTVRFFRMVSILMLLILTSACASTSPAELPINKLSVNKIKQSVYQDTIELIFRDGETQQLVGTLISGQYLHLLIEDDIDIDQIDTVKIYGPEDEVIAKFSLDALGPIRLVIAIAEKGVTKVFKIL